MFATAVFDQQVAAFTKDRLLGILCTANSDLISSRFYTKIVHFFFISEAQQHDVIVIVIIFFHYLGTDYHRNAQKYWLRLLRKCKMYTTSGFTLCIRHVLEP